MLHIYSRAAVSVAAWTHEHCVMSCRRAAKDTAAFVACAGEPLAGKVAIVASATRKVLKSWLTLS